MASGLARLGLPRTVVVLGFVSLLNDAASEMVTPLLPIFLTATLGAGPAIVGLIEGVAEATASLLKYYAGRLSDRGYRAKRLVLGGYALSNVMRPLVAFATAWSAVLAMRFLDRVGKGLRTAPRDALIAAAAPGAIRGRAFGFHRAMDHAGSVVGPLAAFVLLRAGADLGQVFLWSVVPGVAVVLLVAFGVRDEPQAAPPVAEPLRWRALDRRLQALVVAAALLALASVPEVLVILWARDAGLPMAMVPLLWAAASVVKMLVVLPAGVWSDRIGRVPVLIVGWSLRVTVLVALAFGGATGPWVAVLFAGYSATLAFTEAAERSLVGDFAPAGLRGTAFGFYHLVSGAFVLPGAVAFGVLWEWQGPPLAFTAAAIVTAIAAAAMTLAARLRPAG